MNQFERNKIAFKKNQHINPETGKEIKIGGPTHKKLLNLYFNEQSPSKTKTSPKITKSPPKIIASPKSTPNIKSFLLEMKNRKTIVDFTVDSKEGHFPKGKNWLEIDGTFYVYYDNGQNSYRNYWILSKCTPKVSYDNNKKTLFVDNLKITFGNINDYNEVKNKLINPPKSSPKQSPKPSGVKHTVQYEIMDNGGIPFIVKVAQKNVTIYKNVWDENKNKAVMEKYPILTYIVDKIFIGRSVKNPMTEFSSAYGPKYDGNSILLQLKDRYIYIGVDIYSFIPLAPIIKYVSPVGNSGVPYPYAIDAKNNVYLMEDHIIMPNYKGKDPNEDFHNAWEKGLEKKYKPFKYKMIVEGE